ncbi:MAG: hypothetical protein ACI92Z_001225 [Paracoccaceae bacterium]|jgi:hypothetical protein
MALALMKSGGLRLLTMRKNDLAHVTAITGFGDLSSNHMTQLGSDVGIDDLDGNTITLVGIMFGDLDSVEFIF